MSRADTEDLVRRFFDALNAADHEAALALVSDDVVHDPAAGERRIGADKLRWYLADHGRRFEETVADLVVMTDGSGARAAAEYTLRGAYRATAPGLPAATGQHFSISAGSFLEVEDGLIARLTTRLDAQALAAALAHG
jgi:steroid delta-isomerase-like uncharacterized protein